MSKEWKEVTIEEISDVKSGKRLPKGHSLVPRNTGFPYVRLVDVSEGNIRKSGLQFLLPDTQEKIARYIVKENDVCLAIVGHTIGMVFFVNESFAGVNLTENAARLTNFKEGVLSKFVYYYLTSRIGQQEIISRKVGSAQGKLPMYNIKSLPINLPSLPEQKAIANILGKLDDKIALNRQMNQTLEEMAQSLFKSWFVDFDPVLDNALAAGNPIPEALQAKAEKRKALHTQNATRHPKLVSGSAKPIEGFPNSFVYNEELGKYIPEGWEVNSLGGITTELRRGISPKYINEGGVLVLNQKCIRNHEVNYSLARRNDPTKKKVEGRFLQIGDMVVNSTGTGTLGRVANIVSLPEPTIVDSHVTVLRANQELVNQSYFNGLIFSIEKEIEAMGEGSTGQTELSRARLSEIYVLISSMKTQSLVEEQLADFYLKKDSNNNQTQTLTQLRDTLLPQLISGKLKVPEAMLQVEKMLE